MSAPTKIAMDSLSSPDAPPSRIVHDNAAGLEEKAEKWKEKCEMEVGKKFIVSQEALIDEMGGRESKTIRNLIADVRNRLCEGEYWKNKYEANRVWLTEEGARRVRVEFGKGGVNTVGDVVTMEVVRSNYPNKTLVKCRHGDEEVMVVVGRNEHWKYVVGMKVPVKMVKKDEWRVEGRPRMRGKF